VRAVILLVVLIGCDFALCSCGDSATSSSRKSSAPTGAASAADAQYAGAFRQDYVKVVSTLNAVSAACDHTLTTATLPACGKRVAAFRAAIDNLSAYIQQRTPPANAATQVHTAGEALASMQATFGMLAERIKIGNAKAVNAMAGSGKPLTDSIVSFFVAAIPSLDAVLPGQPFPPPAG
jgi:hypothetical protein